MELTGVRLIKRKSKRGVTTEVATVLVTKATVAA